MRKSSYENGTIHISSSDFSDPCLNVKSMTSNTVIVLGAYKQQIILLKTQYL